MSARSASSKIIAETSSKGNQEKWLDRDTWLWHKLDQFGYEALAEAMTAALLAYFQLEAQTPFTFVRYTVETLSVRGVPRVGCASESFLKPGQALISVHRLLSAHLGYPVRKKLAALSSDKKRIAYLAETTAEITGLREFPQYLALLFQIDALICNDDRHLNNIAVLEQNGKYEFCPVFDNGAGLLSNTREAPMDIQPKALLAPLRARPFGMSFSRQLGTVQRLYGLPLTLRPVTREWLTAQLAPLLEFYPARDRALIADRVITCILTRQRA